MLSNNNSVKVLCADDNSLVGEAIGIQLKLAGGFEWLGLLPDADNLLGAVADRQPDVVLLDIDMPGKDPFTAMKELGEVHPDVRVIMFTGHVRNDLIDRAFEHGAWGYVSKSEGAHALISAIQRVKRGEFVMGPEVEQAYRRRN